MPAHPPLSTYSAQRIVLIKPSALGDIVHSLPILSALRRRFPDAHISWVVNRVLEPLLRDHPDLNATIPFDRGVGRSGWMPGVRMFAGLLRTLRAGRFDLSIDLQGLLRSGLMSWATKAPRRVGLSGAREGSRWFYTDCLPRPTEARHAVDRYWTVAEALGCEGPKRFHLPIASGAAVWADQHLGEWPRPWIVLGVGARWLTKRWPPEHFATLSARAQREFGGTLVFVGGSDETLLAARVLKKLRGPHLDFTGRTSLPQLAAVLSRADVMLANDTGPLHLAVALGRPVVAPYTCTRVAWTGPYGQPWRAVESKVWCAGSCHKRCSRMECMTELTPDRLWPALREVLAATWSSQSRSA